MPLTYVNGFDGTASLTTAHNAQLVRWSADFSRVVSDVTGFADNGRRRILGLWDVQGSAAGAFSYDAANTGPGVNSTDWSRSGVVINLGVVGSTAAAYTATAVVSNIQMSVEKGGDSSITFNFQNSGGSVPTEAWDETP
jgi:hypothetical protein